MSFAHLRKCNFVKRDGKKCKAPARKNSANCKDHGGALVRAPRTYGLYAKHLPAGLGDRVEELLNNPKLMDLKQLIALLSALLTDSLERIRECQEKENRSHLTTAETRELAAQSKWISATIERYTKVGRTLKYLVHLDTVQRLMEGGAALSKEFITSESDRQKFAEALSALTVRIIREESEREESHQVGRPVKEIQEDEDTEELSEEW